MEELEGTSELAGDLALFNRVGDLYLKISRVPDAVDMYERAATLYADNGFPNNAIALCNKILRNAPSRTHVYLKLAQLMIERGFVAEAKQNLLEYADRMQQAGRTQEVFRALKEFADLSPDSEEIRLLLAEQLRAVDRDGEAREQLEKLYVEAQASGDSKRSRTTLTNIKAIDPDFDQAKAVKRKVKVKQKKSTDLIFLDVEYDTGAATVTEAPAEPEPLEVEPSAAELEMAEADVETIDGLDVGTGLEAPAEAAVELEPLELEPTSLAEEAPPEVVEWQAPVPETVEEPDLLERETAEAAVEPSLVEVEPEEELALEPVAAGEEDIEVAELDLGADLDEDIGLELPEIGEDLEGVAAGLAEPVAVQPAEEEEEVEEEVEEEEVEEEEVEEEEVEPEPVAAPDAAALEALVAEHPDDPAHHIALGEALVETGERERGLDELVVALGIYEARQEWARAVGLTDKILRIEPGSVNYHQKRVELSYRIGDKAQLSNAYLALADALFRDGAADRARAVYQRVLEHDPENARAQDALVTLAPVEVERPEEPAVAAAAPAPAEDDFIDLGALILEDEPVRDTRIRVEDEEPTGDEERDFAEMLSQFKRGIEENIAEEDWQAHYDLGIAFKEMGLLDEAIAEFQKALRSPPGRLQTAEALGSCFYEKGQFSVAATVMRRAVETEDRGDDTKIGLLYWLGRCEEEQQRIPEALVYYQRVFALDIGFKDVGDRVQQLAQAGT